MHKCLFLLAFFVMSGQAFAQNQRTFQHSKSTTHDYYIYISGVNARADVEKLENSIQKKTGVTYFLSHSYPVKYFLLKSNNPISQQEFAAWIGPQYTVQSYGEGTEGKEKAIVTGKKSKKIQ